MAKREEERERIAKNLAYSSGMRGSEDPPQDEAEEAAGAAAAGAPEGKPKGDEDEPRRRRGQPKDRGVFGSGLRGAEKAPAEK
jgi:hypothetical protein